MSELKKSIDLMKGQEQEQEQEQVPVQEQEQEQVPVQEQEQVPVQEQEQVPVQDQDCCIWELIDGKLSKTCIIEYSMPVFGTHTSKRALISKINGDGTVMVSPNSQWKLGPHKVENLYSTLQAAEAAK